MIVPFTTKSCLRMEQGMNGATGNFYCGLHEFEDMAFVLHLLRANDQFVDIGANIGSYSILASAHCGAKAIAVEPLPSTFERLKANVLDNNIEHLVTLHNSGVGESGDTLKFTTAHDTANHVAADDDFEADTVAVPVSSMDALLNDVRPLCIKIDVEGFEKKVIAGGNATLRSDSLRAVLMELNGSGDRYGFSDDEIHQTMVGFGFLPFKYDPMLRVLQKLSNRNHNFGNTLYLRDVEWVEKRLASAPEIELPWRRIAS